MNPKRTAGVVMQFVILNVLLYCGINTLWSINIKSNLLGGDERNDGTNDA